MEEFTALLLHDGAEPLGTLKPLLDICSIRSRRVHRCEEAAEELARVTSPQLLFTDTALPDGTWREVLALVEKAAAPVVVIVVSRHVDMRLYLETIEAGAADFIVPPFAGSDLAHIIRCAAGRLATRPAGPKSVVKQSFEGLVQVMASNRESL
jgi:DNA-binding NtrC family response regulator